MNQTLEGSDTVALPWLVLLAFVRITTNPKITLPPLSGRAALGYVVEWLGLSCVTIPATTSRHVPILLDLLEATGVDGNLVPDVHLAALAIERGATLCSCDNDFERFPGLEWEVPLA